MLAVENVQFRRQSVTDDELKEIKKIATAFRALVANRQAVARAESKEREEQQHLAENRFEPRLNKKSERLARKFMQQNGLESVRERSRYKARSKSIRDRRSTSNASRGSSFLSRYEKPRNSVVVRLSLSRNRTACNSLPARHDARSNAKTRLEDFLIAQANDRAKKNSLKAQREEEAKIAQCTFSPRINTSMGLRTNSRANSVLEPQSVFQSLYEKSKAKADKQLQSSRQAKRANEQREIEGCTFKPDFSKTQATTEKYLRKWTQPVLGDGKHSRIVNKRALRKFVNHPKADKENENEPQRRASLVDLASKAVSRSFTEQKDIVVCEIRGDDRPIAMRLDSSRQNSLKISHKSDTIEAAHASQHSKGSLLGNDSLHMHDSDATQKQPTQQESSINSLEVVLDARTSQ